MRWVRWRDTAERLFWTVAQAMLGALAGSALFDVAVWKTAATAGLTAAVAFLTILARQRLSVLPAPGEGLPGLPTGAVMPNNVGPVTVLEGQDETDKAKPPPPPPPPPPRPSISSAAATFNTTPGPSWYVAEWPSTPSKKDLARLAAALEDARQEGANMAIKALAENDLEAALGPPEGRHSAGKRRQLLEHRDLQGP